MAAAADHSRAGDPLGAVELLRKAASRKKAPIEAILELARCEHELGRAEEAFAALERAVRARPTSVRLLCQLALIGRTAGKLEESHRAIDAVLRRSPAHRRARMLRAELYRVAGRFDEAGAIIAQMIDAGERAPEAIQLFAALAPRIDRVEEALALLREVIDSPRTPNAMRASSLHRLAILLDARGEYDAAFDALEQAHALAQAPFDAAAWTASVDRITELWTEETLRRAPSADDPWGGWTLLVGLPRAGSTLVEQILSMHPGVYGAGERVELQIASQEVYRAPDAWKSQRGLVRTLERVKIDRLARAHVGAIHALDYTADRITDKMPYNFKHLGLAALLAPGARVIHCRRDPLDTCLSCYMQDFEGAHLHVHSLEDLGVFARTTERLMDHWREHLPLPIVTLDYEKLVRNQESETRRLLEFLELEWDDACLRFHESTRVAATVSNEQVRRKIYTSSVGRARRYAHRLAPLIEALDRHAA